MAKINKIKKKKGRKIMKIELTERQQKRIKYHIKRTEEKLEEIKKKNRIREDTSSEDKYILHRKLTITMLTIIMRNMRKYLSLYGGILFDAEYKELNSLTDDLYHKLIEIDNKLEDIYINMMDAKQWIKINCR